MNNFRYAWCQLVRKPGLSIVIIIMLALGIGITTTMFSVFYQVLVRPLQVPEPDKLVNIRWSGSEPEFMRENLSYPIFQDLEENQQVFTGIAAYSDMKLNLVDQVAVTSVNGVFVSGSYFPVLNLKPVLGRLIGPQDEPGIDESPVIVLSYKLWQTRYGGDPDILGKILTVNNQSMVVIGVAPKLFNGTKLGVRSEIFIPLTMRWRIDPSSSKGMVEWRDAHWLQTFARLKPGVTVEQASTVLNTIYYGLLEEYESSPNFPGTEGRKFFFQRSLELNPNKRGQGSIDGASISLSLLLGITLLVLLIICVNIANLLLARGSTRMREMAIRESVGANRSHLISQLFVESLLPALIGCLLSLPVAVITLSTIKLILPSSLVNGLLLEIGWEAVCFAIFSTLSITILFGLLPALWITRTTPAAICKGFASQTLGGPGVTRTRSLLVTVQIAFAIISLSLAILFTRSLQNVASVDLGIDIDTIVSFNISPRQIGYDINQTRDLYQQIKNDLSAQSFVTSVSSAYDPVISNTYSQLEIGIEDYENGGKPVIVDVNNIGADFFTTLSTPLRAGREFSNKDITSIRHITLVNERFVNTFGLGDNVIGKHIYTGSSESEPWEIIGVVKDASYRGVKNNITPQFFIPQGVFPFSMDERTFYVRTNMNPDVILGMIPRLIANIDPKLPVNNLVTMRRQTQENIFLDRLVSILSTGFAMLAILLVAIGLYGVLSHNVIQRKCEFGVRLSLGATPGNIYKLVLSQVKFMIVLGGALGITGTIVAGRIAESILFGLSGNDPFVLFIAFFVISGVVLTSCCFPALRASRIDPMQALREE